MVTAATITFTGTVSQICFRGNSAQFECFRDVFLDGMLDPMKLFPCAEKTLRNRILQKHIPVFFEISDLDAIRLKSPSLFFLKRVAFAYHIFKLCARAGIRQKGVDSLMDGCHFRLVNDGLAKLPGFLNNHVIVDLIWHKGSVSQNQVNKSGQIPMGR